MNESKVGQTEQFDTDEVKKLNRALTGYAIARGVVFWYAIEKLFELHIGLSLENIVLIGVVAQGSKVLFELPTSVIADRWNRRNILVVASLFLIASCMILGLANSLTVYLIGTVLWSINDALTSGVYEAFIYDSFVAVHAAKRFRALYSRLKSIGMLSLALAGIAAGMLAGVTNYRVTFFLSAITTIAAVWLLMRLKEPPIVRSTELGLTWFRHLHTTLKTLRQPLVRWMIVLYVALWGFLSIWYEYYQLVGIDVHVPKWLFGSMIAILTVGMAIGYEISHRWPASRRLIALSWGALILGHVLGLQFRSVPLAMTNLFLIFVSLSMTEVYIEVAIHDNIESSQRASVFSMAGTLGYAWFFVLAFAFSQALSHFGARRAMLITSLPLVLVGMIDLIYLNKRSSLEQVT